MATTKITATFWDCGGVFLTNGWDHHARRRVVEHFGLNFEEFESRHEEPNDAWERGAISLQQYLQQTVFCVQRSFSQDAFIAQMQAASKIIYPEMIAFVRRLRSQRPAAADAGIYLLSNESRELMDYRIPQFGLAGLFDAYVVSAYIGMRKPNADFFRCALDLAHRKPEACAFVDDREENVAAACDLGIHGIRMEKPQQVIEALNELGVTVS